MSRFYVDEKIFPPKGQRYTAVYSRDKEYLCVLTKNSHFNLQSCIVFSNLYKTHFLYGIGLTQTPPIFSLQLFAQELYTLY